jgi:hypothetical protein
MTLAPILGYFCPEAKSWNSIDLTGDFCTR